MPKCERCGGHHLEGKLYRCTCGVVLCHKQVVTQGAAASRGVTGDLVILFHEIACKSKASPWMSRFCGPVKVWIENERKAGKASS